MMLIALISTDLCNKTAINCDYTHIKNFKMYYYELLNVPPTNILDIRHFFDIGHFIFCRPQAKNFVGTIDGEEERKITRRILISLV